MSPSHHPMPTLLQCPPEPVTKMNSLYILKFIVYTFEHKCVRL